MSERYLLMWLEGPLQSWGDRSAFALRETLPFPTKSGLLGMLFCGMGLGGPQEKALEELRGSSLTVFSLKRPNVKPTVLEDFHMVGSAYDVYKDPWHELHIPRTAAGKKAVGGGAKLTRRYYLQDAAFACILSVPGEWAARMAEGLTRPVWPIFLGRKNCVPSEPIFMGSFDERAAALVALKTRLANPECGWGVFERIDEIDQGGAGTMVLQDVPLAFGQHRRFLERRVMVRRTNFVS